jgi:uncharacterized membrane protein
MARAHPIPHVFSRRFIWAGYLIGFALGGFFDGILLHQILQWHHLLSGLDGEALRDLRVQVLADGIFHALMYGLGAAGLWMLYRTRREFTGVRADRNLLADVLIGFGIWHVIDALLSHWLTGIHRIRMDVSNPLAWDIGWLVLVGLPPLMAGLWMKRRYPREAVIADRRGSRRNAVAVSIAAFTLFAGWWAALPAVSRQGFETVTVVLRPDVTPARFLSSLRDSEARVLWSDRAGGVWVLTSTAESPMRHYGRGAIYVSGSLLPAGCAGWFRT